MIATADSESALPERLRAGDPLACERLVRTQGSRLLTVARHLLRSERGAREAVQETFIAAFRLIRQPGEAPSLPIWLLELMIQKALKKARAGSTRGRSSIEDFLPLFDRGGRHAGPVQEWPAAAREAAAGEETRARVRALIGSLPLDYRVVLVLKDLQGLSAAEIEHILHLSPEAVKNRLHLARQALRTKLALAFASAEPRRPPAPAPA